MHYYVATTIPTPVPPPLTNTLLPKYRPPPLAGRSLGPAAVRAAEPYSILPAVRLSADVSGPSASVFPPSASPFRAEVLPAPCC